MVHSIGCSCGKLQGHIKGVKNINRCVCYCSDCQAFARYLNKDVVNNRQINQLIGIIYYFCDRYFYYSQSLIMRSEAMPLCVCGASP
ncbi:MAG: hypothetical protein AAGE84_02555 [Cyanobacteria bacterium P01_G01_bin.39]